MLDLPLAADLLVAALIGLAVGIEREWSGHTEGPNGRFAGARTFTLLAAIGGFAGWFFRTQQPEAAAIALAAGVLFPIVAYASTMRRPGTTTDSTTEVVAVLVVLIGAVSGLGQRSLASAAAAVIVLLLAEKSALQAALQRVAPNEMRAALQFAVLSLVILPLIPDGSFGPFDAFRPRSLWTIVLVLSALNFAGYIARRAIGETRGLGVTGLLGGLVSSTAVTLTFSRRSREEPTLSGPLALGVVAACTVLIPRLLVICLMLQPPVALAALPVLGPVLVSGTLLIAYTLWTERAIRPDPSAPLTSTPLTSTPLTSPGNGMGTNPLGLWSSLQMALAFQVVLFVVSWVESHVGAQGVLASATILGLTDMDALTVSMTRYGALAPQVGVAAAAIGIGVLANTVLKGGLILMIGAPHYRARALTGLAVLAASSVLGLVIGWPP